LPAPSPSNKLPNKKPRADRVSRTLVKTKHWPKVSKRERERERKKKKKKKKKVTENRKKNNTSQSWVVTGTKTEKSERKTQPPKLASTDQNVSRQTNTKNRSTSPTNKKDCYLCSDCPLQPRHAREISVKNNLRSIDDRNSRFSSHPRWSVMNVFCSGIPLGFKFFCLRVIVRLVAAAAAAAVRSVAVVSGRRE
jgi:outer membrane biosynthesis protein TonB